MEAIFQELTQIVLDQAKELPAESRFVVGISGIPGSGKTTFAKEMVRRINARLEEQEISYRALYLGMDGWHFSRSQLDKFQNPKEAHARRGAAFTIDGEGLASFVNRLKNPIIFGECKVILAPSFDHAVKDPVQDDIAVEETHKIILFEGLYLHTDLAPWREAVDNFDELWFIDIDRPRARKRIVERHLLTGICPNIKSAEDRADQNDLPNGDWIEAHAVKPTRRIASLEDISLVP